MGYYKIHAMHVLEGCLLGAFYPFPQQDIPLVPPFAARSLFVNQSCVRWKLPSHSFAPSATPPCFEPLAWRRLRRFRRLRYTPPPWNSPLCTVLPPSPSIPPLSHFGLSAFLLPPIILCASLCHWPLPLSAFLPLRLRRCTS